MAQAFLYSGGGGYSTLAGVPTAILTIPATVPLVGRASIYFLLQSSTPWFAPTPVSYIVTFTPYVGAPIPIMSGSSPFGVTPVPITIAHIATYLGGNGVAEDTSGNLIDAVASGGVISLTTLGADAGVCAAIVLQADSPVGYQMRPVGLGGFSTFTSPPSLTGATMGAINKNTGPFISLLTFVAVNGGNSPAFVPNDSAIVLSPLLDEEANNAVIAVRSYVSPAAWGITPATWFLLPPISPAFTVATTWTGATYAYAGVSSTIAYRPLDVIPVTVRSRGFAQVVG